MGDDICDILQLQCRGDGWYFKGGNYQNTIGIITIQTVNPNNLLIIILCYRFLPSHYMDPSDPSFLNPNLLDHPTDHPLDPLSLYVDPNIRPVDPNVPQEQLPPPEDEPIPPRDQQEPQQRPFQSQINQPPPHIRAHEMPNQQILNNPLTYVAHQSGRAFNFSKARFIKLMENINIQVFIRTRPLASACLVTIVLLLFVFFLSFSAINQSPEVFLPANDLQLSQASLSKNSNPFRPLSENQTNLSTQYLEVKGYTTKLKYNHSNPQKVQKTQEIISKNNDQTYAYESTETGLALFGQSPQDFLKELPQESNESGQQQFQISPTLEGTILGEALKKYSFYEKYIEKIEKEIIDKNLYAVGQARYLDQLDQLQFRYNDKGKLIEFDQTRHGLGLKTLNLFPLLHPRETTPFMFTSSWDLFKITCCRSWLQDPFGWSYLHEFLKGKGPWASVGSVLTVGSLSDNGFDYKYSNFNLFVPSIIRFVFPTSIEDGTEILIYGIRMRYDLYLRKETYVLRELLGRFRINKTEDEKQHKLGIRRDFYCESMSCMKALSFVKIISRKKLQICRLKIESIYAYDFNEGRT